MPSFSGLFKGRQRELRHREGRWGKEVLAVSLIERIPGHYDVQEMEYGRSYHWRFTKQALNLYRELAEYLRRFARIYGTHKASAELL